MTEINITPEKIIKDLPTRFIGQKVIYFPRLDSTMEAAKREALWGAPAGTIIVAGEQTAGKGRLQRTWISPMGGLALSVILRPNLEKLPYMIMLASVSVVNAIWSAAGVKAQIKWPNDVLIKERKVSGILIENDIRKNVLKHCIIGIGINVNVKVKDYPDIASIAISLSDLTGKKVSELEVLRQLLIEMDSLYTHLDDAEYIFNIWKNNLVTLGQKVQATIGQNIYKGTAESVTSDGNLILRQSDGSLIKIIAGDVTLG